MNITLIDITSKDHKVINVDLDTTLMEIVQKYYNTTNFEIIAAKVNNEIMELNYQIKKPCIIEFLDMNDEDGMRIYRRSLYFIMLKAFNDVFPEKKIVLGHALHKGTFCEISNEDLITHNELMLVENRMKEIVREKLPFIKTTKPISEAKEIFKKSGRSDRFRAISARKKDYVTIYNCGGYEDYYYGYMAPDTAYIKLFRLIPYGRGFVVIYPDKSNLNLLPEFIEQRKLYAIFREHRQWGKILGIDCVGALNEMIQQNKCNEVIRIAEALQEKKIAQIADMITNNISKKKVILIAGPSSSGKTTFANRLSIQLKVNGVKPVTISLDNYFVKRENTPIDETGDYDFEALEAIDIKLFNEQLAGLIAGKEVEVPIFNFPKGNREENGTKMQIDENSVLVIEGIHGLNEKLSESIPAEEKFKIYVSALTHINIDDHNRIPSTDNRMLRRIVRDYQFRGVDAASTISRWPSVRRGEEKNIFPYQENADIMFNSALIYELSALKKIAESLLNEIKNDKKEFSEAKRLLEFLSYFNDIDTSEIPFNSIMREFIGGSCFYKE
jgi:uridine kinase